jgi:hypothetical protein
VLAEIRDGLTETIDAHLADGMTPDAAATTPRTQYSAGTASTKAVRSPAPLTPGNLRGYLISRGGQPIS